MTEIERHDFDVVIIGAGGAGLRAAIESRASGLRTAIICKSLFGKAHTVMAEGGIAASMGNVNSNDNWQVHFVTPCAVESFKIIGEWLNFMLKKPLIEFGN